MQQNCCMKRLILDQDILNFVFDEKYNVMSNNLNFPAEINNKEFTRDLRSVIFLHYSGSNKPWTVLGAMNSYQKIFITITR